MSTEDDLFKEAVEQSANMIIITDNKGIIRYVNPKFEEITEYTLDEVRGKYTNILKSGSIPDEVYKDLWETISKGKIWSGELLNKTKSGNLFWVYMTINPIVVDEEITNFLAIQEVITERKSAQEALIEFKEQFKGVLQSTLDGLAILDEHGKLVQGNTALEKIFGYSMEELNTADNLPRFLIPEDQHKRFMTGWELFKKTGTGPSINRISEWDGVRKDNSRINLEVSISTIKKYRGNDLKTWLVVVLRDITKRKSQELQIKNQNEELSEFAHTMSHDLRSHLQNIQIQTHLIQMTTEDMDQEIQEDLKKYITKINDQTSFINELLSRSVKLADAGLIIIKEDKINISSLIEEVSKLSIPSSIKINKQIDDKLLVCDKEKISQVLSNIFENIVKHSLPQNVNISFDDKNASGGMLTIENDGKKISREKISKFMNSKKQSIFNSKNGFGFLIINKIISAHGWSVELTDEPLTKYTITIPKADLE